VDILSRILYDKTKDGGKPSGLLFFHGLILYYSLKQQMAEYEKDKRRVL